MADSLDVAEVTVGSAEGVVVEVAIAVEGVDEVRFPVTPVLIYLSNFLFQEAVSEAAAYNPGPQEEAVVVAVGESVEAAVVVVVAAEAVGVAPTLSWNLIGIPECSLRKAKNTCW